MSTVLTSVKETTSKGSDITRSPGKSNSKARVPSKELRSRVEPSENTDASGSDFFADSLYSSSVRSETSYSCHGGSNLPPKDAPSLKTSRVYKAPLTPLDCSFGIVTEKKQEQLPLRDMVLRESKKFKSDVTVVYAIRHPGDGLCREQAIQLTEFAGYCDTKINIVGLVKKEKQMGKNTLLEFRDEYFKFPIYRDDKCQSFSAMGNRQVPVVGLFSTMPKMLHRFRRNNTKHNTAGGDAFTLGGLFVFDKEANLRFTYYEIYDEEFDMALLRQAVEDASMPLFE